MQIGPRLESVLKGITLSEDPSATDSAMVSSNSNLKFFLVKDFLKPQVDPVGADGLNEVPDQVSLPWLHCASRVRFF
jgi:hypothetical protein